MTAQYSPPKDANIPGTQAEARKSQLERERIMTKMEKQGNVDRQRAHGFYQGQDNVRQQQVQQHSRAKLAKNYAATAAAVGKAWKDRKKASVAVRHGSELTHAIAGAFGEIRGGEDFLYFLAIMLAVVADFLGLIPAAGGILTIPFAVSIWMIFLIKNHFRGRKANLKLTTTIVSSVAEVFGLGIVNVLPIYTINALVNYGIALVERSIEKDEELKEELSRAQLIKFQEHAHRQRIRQRQAEQE